MRVNFNVPDELVARLDAFCKENYSTRSSVMCQACDQFLTAKEVQKMFGEMTRLLRLISERIKDNDTVDDETLQKMDEFLALSRMLSGQSLNPAELDHNLP